MLITFFFFIELTWIRSTSTWRSTFHSYLSLANMTSMASCCCSQSPVKARPTSPWVSKEPMYCLNVLECYVIFHWCFSCDPVDLNAEAALDWKLIKRKGSEYAHISRDKVDFTTSRLKLSLTGLFGGDKALSNYLILLIFKYLVENKL